MCVPRNGARRVLDYKSANSILECFREKSFYLWHNFPIISRHTDFFLMDNKFQGSFGIVTYCFCQICLFSKKWFWKFYFKKVVSKTPISQANSSHNNGVIFKQFQKGTTNSILAGNRCVGTEYWLKMGPCNENTCSICRAYYCHQFNQVKFGEKLKLKAFPEK